ncbi:hypothetical protein MVEG_01287 [Podila verticillata NRRL 6337]|nr:hypothetical protein MVEG_01287 [Podila verticillata NRRL 6337]
MLFNIATLAILALATTVSANGKPGQIVQITSATNWCMMMPPVRGGDIAQNEDRAVAFCTQDSPLAPKARLFPDGFIRAAHFAQGDGYVQITGKIDHTKYGLSDNDQGGQYDLKAPVGSFCAGYSSYVNLIEPHADIFCIRCCKNKKDCNTGKSTYGCKVVVPGDYSDSTGPVPSSSSSSSSSFSVPATSTHVLPVSSSTPVASPLTSPIAPTSSALVVTTTTGPVTSPTSNPNAAVANSASLLSVAAIGVAALLAL